MTRLVQFFATRRDLLDVMSEAEARRDLHYAEAGMFECSEPLIYPSAAAIPELGEIRVPRSILGRILLIGVRETSFAVESVCQRRGGMRYVLSQKENPDTISLHPGGQFNKQVLLAGDFGTCTDSTTSVDLFEVVCSAIRKRRWTRIRGYTVGIEAARMLDLGGRLTRAVDGPHEFDLARAGSGRGQKVDRLPIRLRKNDER